MKIQVSKLLPIDEFLDYSEEIFPLPIAPCEVRDPDGRTTRIQPGLVSYTGLTVLGGDWIPITARGEVCFEQMIHSPGLYLHKKESRLQRRGNALEAEVSELRRHSGRATLVGGSSNYYHWLVDYLPRLILRMRYGPEGDDVLLLDDSSAPFQAQSLELLGLARSKVMRLPATEAVQFDEILVPTLLSNYTVVHPVVPQLLREVLGWKPGSGKRRVFLSRADAPSRRIVNESELMPVLERYGFERVVPGHLSLGEQRDLFADAEAVLAVHGAALTNVMFCRPGTDLFEIYTPLHRPTFFQRLADLCGCPHRFVEGRSVNLPPDAANPLMGDIEVDVAVVKAALEERFGSGTSAR